MESNNTSSNKEEKRYCPIDNCWGELETYEPRGFDVKTDGMRYQCLSCGRAIGHNFTLNLIQKEEREKGQGLLGFDPEPPRVA